MAYRKSRLKLKHQDLAINVDIRTGKLTPETIEEQPDVIRRDQQSGSLVVRQIYDKASGEPLEEGYGYRWVNEAGEDVPVADIELYTIRDAEEQTISKHEPTVGAARTVTADTWIPVATSDAYLIKSIYEIWGEEPTDGVQLLELAEHIRDFDVAPVVPFMLQPTLFKQWGIITPFFGTDSFSLIVRITEQKIEPAHAMPLRPEEAIQESEPAPTLEQESPFE